MNSQESQIKRIFGSMIGQKLQDFDEDVKPLGDIMTQVHHNTAIIKPTSIVSDYFPPLVISGQMYRNYNMLD